MWYRSSGYDMSNPDDPCKVFLLLLGLALFAWALAVVLANVVR